MKAARYEIKRCRSVFTRCGYAVSLFDTEGKPFTPWLPVYGALDMRSQRTSYMPCPMPATFFGDDGRKVRAEAIRWAREHMA